MGVAMGMGRREFNYWYYEEGGYSKRDCS